MNKEQILEEIRRTTSENGGTPLGSKRFESETGIPKHEWWGRHWGRWSDALREAGFSPNKLQDSFSDDSVLEKLVQLIRELGRYPGNGDLRLKKRKDPSFPNEKVLSAHFGPANSVRRAVVAYCEKQSGLDDVTQICLEVKSVPDVPKEETPKPIITGFVYLMKHSKHFKIGKTNATGRREYELAIQLPEKLKTVHVIKTDDPDGIEAYWHKRFAAKRGNGEWFELSPDDVRAFKSRKFM